MEILKTLYIVIYVILIAVIVYFLIRLFLSIKKMMGDIDTASQKIGHLSENIEIVNNHLETIKNSTAAWEFFAAWIIIFGIIKETLKNNREESLGRSFRKALIHNTRKLSSIKL